MATPGGGVAGDGSVPTPLDLEELQPGTNVLIAGPAMTGKRQLMLDVVGSAPDRSAIVVTTKKSADQIRAALGKRQDLTDWELGVVDCVTRQRAAGRVVDSADVRYLSSAADLTGIGIAVSGWMQDRYHDPERRRTRIGLHSLSTLLMYADLRRVYQFVHVITGRIESSGFAGVFTIDTATDAETLNRLTQLFDRQESPIVDLALEHLSDD
jgi:hypothetical protein